MLYLKIGYDEVLNLPARIVDIIKIRREQESIIESHSSHFDGRR